MKKNPETGNEVNISNFDELYKRCEAIGITYKPSNEAITLPALAKLLANAKQAQKAVNVAESDLKTKNNLRVVAFRKVKPLATRVINALICTKTMPGMIDHMRSLLHKIRGTRVKPLAKPDPVVNDPNAKKRTRSVSEQSFISMMAHLHKVISLLNTIPEYQPNEEDLQPIALNALLADLAAKHDAVSDCYIILDAARTNRDSLLYAHDTGLVDIALTVKAYAKSIGEKEYRSVSSIPFRARETD